MKRFFTLVCLVLCAFTLAVISFAHPGGTDGNGGHYNYDTGEYHYHHGYPEHQHEDGVCPYKLYENNTTTTNDSKEFNYNEYPTERINGDIYDYLEEYYDGEGVVKEYRAGECTQENCPIVNEAHGHILRETTTEHIIENEKTDLKQVIDDMIKSAKDCVRALIFLFCFYGSLYGIKCIVDYIKNKRK